MKLYTAEQVIRAINIGFTGEHEYYTQIIDRLTPIEFPSDEEIEKEWNDERLEQLYIDGAIDGANWIKEQLINKIK